MTKLSFMLLLMTTFMAAACNGKVKTPAAAPEAAPTVGADMDEHGCKGSAGYQWSVVKNECIRIFESGIRLDPKASHLDKSLSAFVVFKSDTDDAQAEVFIPGEVKSRVFSKVADDGAGSWKQDTLLLTQWKGTYTLQGASKKTLYEGAVVK